MFAAHSAGDTRMGGEANAFARSCSMAHSFQAQGVSSQLLVIDNAKHSFSESELAEIYQGAAHLFYTAVIERRADQARAGREAA